VPGITTGDSNQSGSKENLYFLFICITASLSEGRIPTTTEEDQTKLGGTGMWTKCFLGAGRIFDKKIWQVP